jgi:hypothetical protein
MKIITREVQDPVISQSHPLEGASGASFGDNCYSGYQWSWKSINRYAPEAPGIYGLYNALWIYIGQTKNLRAQMLGHFYGDNPCIVHYQPSGFAFELVSPQDHCRGFEELIRQLEPLCRGKAFAFSPVQDADLVSYVESGKRIRRSV